MPINDASSGINKGLVLAAAYFVRKRNEKIRQNNLPDDIEKATTIETPVQSSQGTSIDVVIDLDKETGAPMAAAFEYGSGIWSERGPRQRYKIEPGEGKALLAFPWDEAQALNPSAIGRGTVEISKKGKAFLPSVMHPGVQSKPYIRPTLVEERAEIRKILGREFINAISLKGRVEIIE